ncbi:E3 ubiquitin-protein ligase [Halotydeus destructor]|nr:E3 ubiquitin-protein ligase [Halotydeus destructor]
MFKFNSAQNYIEGVGNEVLEASGFFVLSLVLIGYCSWKSFRGYELRIHPEQRDEVESARQHLRLLQSNRLFEPDSGGDTQENSNLGENSNHTSNSREQPRHFGMDNQCPVCLNEPRLPVETNCGHLFCANCIVVYWRHANWMGPVRCPVCRTEVSVILTCFRLESTGTGSPEEIAERQQVLRDINDYNRRFSGEPRPWLDYIRDLPTLLRHIGSEFFTLGGLMYMLRIRIVLCFMAAIMYLISPLDLIPEAVFGILGLLDDLFVVLLLAIYVSMIYRRFLADRWVNHE